MCRLLYSTLPMLKNTLLPFLKKYRYAVLATSSVKNIPEAALVGVVVTEELELVFDTLTISRKYAHLKQNPKVALVIGGWEGGEITVQYEGMAQELGGQQLEHWKEFYFETFPDGRDRAQWDNITYFIVRPTWIRYSDFSKQPVLIEELRF